MKKLLLTLLFSIAFTGIANAQLTTSLRAYYSFDTNSNDIYGSYNGTPVNSPTYTAGKIGNALTCSSASSQYVDLPNAVFPWGTNTFSVNMWIKMSNTSGNRGWFMVARTGQGAMFYKSGTNIIDWAKPNVVSTSYTWTGIDTSLHMWTVVADGSGMRYYLDGNTTPVASNTNTTNFTDPGPGDLIPLCAYRSAGSLQAGWYFDGQIDEMGVWSKALSTSEITELWNGGNGNNFLASSSTQPTTLGFFRFFKRF